jgi:hypothetical protein
MGGIFIYNYLKKIDGFKIHIFYVNLVSIMLIYSCQGNGDIPPTQDSYSDCKIFSHIFSNQIASATSDDDGNSARVLWCPNSICIEINHEAQIILDPCVDSEIPIDCRMFWMDVRVPQEQNQEDDDDYVIRSIIEKKLFTIFIFPNKFIVVEFNPSTKFNPSTSTTSVVNTIFDSKFASAFLDDGSFPPFDDIEKYLDPEFPERQPERLRNVCDLMVCRDLHNQYNHSAQLKVMSGGDYLFFSVFSARFCDEEFKFKTKRLNFSFPTEFDIICENFELTFSDLHFVVSFSIKIDGKIYQVRFYLDSFEGVGFEHQNDCVILSMYLDADCRSIYCDDSDDYELTRHARVEIEIPGFVPPEDDSDLEKSLKMLPRPIESFLQRLTWKNLSE